MSMATLLSGRYRCESYSCAQGTRRVNQATSLTTSAAMSDVEVSTGRLYLAATMASGIKVGTLGDFV